jgi:dihydroorotate dehydrogenase
MDIYQTAIRPILFSGLKADPEWLHQQTLKTLHWLDQNRDRPPTRWLRHQMRQAYSLTDSRLTQPLWGLTFPNPLGLAAGFDKDGIASGIWADFGFGFAELGTVTLHPQPGNPRPRLFRLPLDQAVLNRMGFNNQGAKQMAQTLSQRWGNWQSKQDRASPSLPSPSSPSPSPFPLGINLGKSKITPLQEAAEDYLDSFRLLQDWGDYFVVNVSSPNTPGLRSLQARENLKPILHALQQENQQQKPLLIKIAPDLEWEDIAAVVDLAQKHHLAGIIATNTTISRDGLKTQWIGATGKTIQEEAGGISGAPLRQRSTEVIHFIYKETQGKLPIIGVGGIFTAEDAWEKITAGASLIQVYTGWIYEGPWMVRRILSGLVEKMQEQGLASISQAVGRN